MFRLVLALSVAATLAGCSSAPINTSSAPSVPIERVYEKTLIQPAEGRVDVVVARDKGFVGGGCNTAVYLDGTKIAAIHQGEMITLYLAPGRYILGHGPNPEGSGLCKYGAESARKETGVTAELGKPLKYRLAISANGESSIMPTAF